jgi:hypothetical protein
MLGKEFLVVARQKQHPAASELDSRHRPSLGNRY